MRPAVRLTRRRDGGFRVDGLAAATDVVPRDGGFVIEGRPGWRLAWSDAEHGWLLTDGEQARELGRTTASGPGRTVAPSSVLLEDGRLFRLAWVGASEPRVELGRWDLPGAYLEGRPDAGAWELTKTPAGEAIDAGPELWILACAEIGRVDGWW